MPVKGFQGTSLLDYPARIAALVFYSRCNMCCAYCHNATLVNTPEEYPDISDDDVVAMVAARRNFIDGVVISGGEPTLDAAMPLLVERLKGLGMLIKLDTNGLQPQVLTHLIQDKLLDFVSLDLKTAPLRYPALGAPPAAAETLMHSIEVLRKAEIEVEFRTTCMPGYVGADDIHALGKLMQGTESWVLQQFVPAHAMDESARHTQPYTKAQMQELLGVAQQYVDNAGVRGV
ncbi:MAG: anaerobic ribonucleoside-triphosphate reductase activating protein [Desulfuromonadaceae bacterium]|nr:anaerobic ribonucleoside-triphosphate reductase activating protein [Desulfuromonadaceae bacterium]